MKNRRTIHLLLAFLIMSFFALSCSDWVEKVDPLISQVEDDRLDNEESMMFVLRGVKGSLGASGEGGGMPQLLWRISGYGDTMLNDPQINGGGAGPDHIQWVQDLPMNLDFVRGDWNRYHRIRFLADDMVERIGRIGTFEDNNLREEALWWGNFVGGLMRLYLAYHWGWDKNGSTPGAPISFEDAPGDLLTPSQIVAQALTKFNAALGFDPGTTEGVPEGKHDEVVHSFMARAYLFEGDYSNAKSHAGQGLTDGAFETLASDAFSNRFWSRSGRSGSTSFSMNYRFAEYIRRDPAEGVALSELTAEDMADIPARAAQSIAVAGPEGESGEPGHRDTDNPRAHIANQNERLPLWERLRLPANEADTQVLGWGQDKYIARSDNIELIDWREMQLILAEVAIRSGDVAQGAVHINNVREFHSLSTVDVATLNAFNATNGGASTEDTDLNPRAGTRISVTGALGYLVEERDKTLWMKGTRIVDQQRFDLWHLESDTWIYIPIPTTESKVNPNLQNRARDL